LVNFNFFVRSRLTSRFVSKHAFVPVSGIMPEIQDRKGFTVLPVYALTVHIKSCGRRLPKAHVPGMEMDKLLVLFPVAGLLKIPVKLHNY
jgi:hypothetical protein